MDYADYFRFLLALIFVLGLIGGLALLARRAGFGYPANPKSGSANRRLEVIETAMVDGRRRLVLVRRDDVEHLLILGQNSETLIETGITPPSDKARATTNNDIMTNNRTQIQSGLE